MKSRSQIYIQVVEEMPYASDSEIQEEVCVRMNHQFESKELYNDEAMCEGMHYPDAYGSGSIFDY